MPAAKQRKRPKKTDFEYPREGLATASQAAKFLGMSRYSVYRLIQAGKLIKAEFDHPIRVPWAELHRLAAPTPKDQ